MRLIQLKIKNIASLKGDHEVNFDSIVKESPLFAITGDTGAGKSTLLNCIALSLYGEIYKKGVNQTDVVTLGEKEGSIELLFQVQGKFYLAEWKGRIRKQNGELLKNPLTDRNIFELDGHDINSTRIKRIDSAEKLLNLDFDQFCKCIILNQGEFARFLSSSFTERKDILEKLYPTGNLLEIIGIQLKREIDSFEKLLSDVEIEYRTINGSGPDISDLEKQKTSAIEKLATKKEWLDYLIETSYHFTSLKNYHLKHSENNSKLNVINAEIANMTSKLNELLIFAFQAEEKFKAAQEKHQKEIPKLQELLKREESLNSLKQQFKIVSERHTQTEKLVSVSSSKIQNLEGELNSWSKAKLQLESSFHFDKSKLEFVQDEIDTFIDFVNKKELISTELNGKRKRLQELEEEGISKTNEINELSKRLERAPTNLKEEINLLLKEKKDIQDKRDLQQKALAQLQECKSQLETTIAEIVKNESLFEETKKRHHEIDQELIPIQTTLRLQSLISAVDVCLNHPEVTEKCPVCESYINQQKLTELRLKLKKADIIPLKMKEESLSKELIRLEQTLSHTSEQILILKNKLKLDTEREAFLLKETANEIKPEIIDQRLNELQKLSWEFEKATKDVEKLTIDRDRTRTHYSQTKKEILALENQGHQTFQVIDNFSKKFNDPALMDNISLFKDDAKKFKTYNHHLNQGDRIKQEIKHHKNLKEHHLKDLEKLNLEINNLKVNINTLTNDLKDKLGAQTASELITQLQDLNQSLLMDFNKKQEELKKHELQLKESNGRLSSLNELLKEIEMLFEQEKTILKSFPNPKSTPEDDDLNTLIKSIPTLGLTLKSPLELFLTLADLLKSKNEFIQKSYQDLQLNLAEINARLSDWDKRKDRLALLELKRAEVLGTLNKKQKLYEVIGRDEMRTYVLSVVEENLIIQTNEELHKLCQGRYEIVHQIKKQKLPEFYILDKFREGGLRKVSTLSGGETFMVSLAMALGLAELTRGSAEIDSLFIDEGFGTLDQNSLEDVLDMLKQIQTRGLMVGLISHVRSLTSALPLNLLLTKRSDGTSQISLQYN